MAKYLSIVENAYRATIEEQDDTAIWFMHAMSNAGAQTAVLLRGNAVNYAAKGQDASGLRFGAKKLDVPPHIDKDVSAIIDKKVQVFVVSEDLAERGLARGDLVSGVETISRTGLAKFVDGFDRVFHW